MEKIIRRLDILADNISKKESLEETIESLNKRWIEENNKPLTKVDDFDKKNKQYFVTTKIGTKPKEPSKALALVPSKYKKKKQEYETEMEKYNADKFSAEEEYYSIFQEERQRLFEADNNERAKNIADLSQKLENAKSDLEIVTEAIETEKVIAPGMKDVKSIRKIIGILRNGRADSVKEAITIMYEDMHRERMEELQKKQVELTEEAKDAAIRAEQKAKEALELAKKTSKRVDESYEKIQRAYDKAQDAHIRAQDAYSKAQDAYSRAQRGV